MQVIQHLRVRRTSKESLISVNTISREQGSAWGRDVLADVGKERVCGGGGGGGRGADGGGEARAAVGVDAPLRHRVEGGVWDMDDCFEAGRFEEV